MFRVDRGCTEEEADRVVGKGIHVGGRTDGRVVGAAGVSVDVPGALVDDGDLPVGGESDVLGGEEVAARRVAAGGGHVPDGGVGGAGGERVGGGDARRGAVLPQAAHDGLDGVLVDGRGEAAGGELDLGDTVEAALVVGVGESLENGVRVVRGVRVGVHPDDEDTRALGDRLERGGLGGGEDTDGDAGGDVPDRGVGRRSAAVVAAPIAAGPVAAVVAERNRGVGGGRGVDGRCGGGGNGDVVGDRGAVVRAVVGDEVVESLGGGPVHLGLKRMGPGARRRLCLRLRTSRGTVLLLYGRGEPVATALGHGAWRGRVPVLVRQVRDGTVRVAAQQGGEVRRDGGLRRRAGRVRTLLALLLPVLVRGRVTVRLGPEQRVLGDLVAERGTQVQTERSEGAVAVALDRDVRPLGQVGEEGRAGDGVGEDPLHHVLHVAGEARVLRCLGRGAGDRPRCRVARHVRHERGDVDGVQQSEVLAVVRVLGVLVAEDPVLVLDHDRLERPVQAVAQRSHGHAGGEGAAADRERAVPEDQVVEALAQHLVRALVEEGRDGAAELVHRAALEGVLLLEDAGQGVAVLGTGEQVRHRVGEVLERRELAEVPHGLGEEVGQLGVVRAEPYPLAGQHLAERLARLPGALLPEVLGEDVAHLLGERLRDGALAEPHEPGLQVAADATEEFADVLGEGRPRLLGGEEVVQRRPGVARGPAGRRGVGGLAGRSRRGRVPGGGLARAGCLVPADGLRPARGRNVGLVRRGRVRLAGGGDVALAGGGDVALAGGGDVALAGGGDVALAGGGDVAL
ncbi:hypothetical protein ACIQCR_32970, partial [Streptomyces sp. NPDC093249]